jgi:hypothetical protein
MKVLVLIDATADGEPGKMPSTQVLADMEKLNEDLVAADIVGYFAVARGRDLDRTCNAS